MGAINNFTICGTCLTKPQRLYDSDKANYIVWIQQTKVLADGSSSFIETIPIELSNLSNTIDFERDSVGKAVIATGYLKFYGKTNRLVAVANDFRELEAEPIAESTIKRLPIREKMQPFMANRYEKREKPADYVMSEDDLPF